MGARRLDGGAACGLASAGEGHPAEAALPPESALPKCLRWGARRRAQASALRVRASALP